MEAFHLDEFSSSISGNKALFVVHGSSARNMPMVDLQSNSSLSLCETGLEGAHLTKGITMTSSGFLITDSNLRIGGDMTWTDGVIGYQATEDCVRGADHSHVQDTQTSPYYLMTNTIVNISSHVEGATLTLDGLGWKNSVRRPPFLTSIGRIIIRLPLSSISTLLFTFASLSHCATVIV